MGTMALDANNTNPNGTEDTGMTNLITRLYVKTREFARAQTMTEYALILAAVAVVVVAGYQLMGNTISNLLNTVDNKL